MRRCLRCGEQFTTWQSGICGDCDKSLIEQTKVEQDKKTRHAISEEIRKCLVRWRCAACGHELIEMPEEPFGPCPKCGVSGVHYGFHDNRPRLVRLVNELLK